MTQRDALLVTIGVLAAALVSLLLFVAVLVRQSPAAPPNIVVRRGPQPTLRPVPEVQRQLPPEYRFIAPLVPLQRGMTDATREAAGLLLVIVLTGSALVLAREQVVRITARSAGSWPEQLRVFGIGVGVLLVGASVLLLTAMVLLRSFAGMPAPSFVFGVQTMFAVLAFVLVVIAAAALLGFSAMCWRLGAWVLRQPTWRQAGERVPAAAATLTVAAVLYLAAQIPVAGPVIAALIVAYSLGAFVASRLAPPAAAGA